MSQDVATTVHDAKDPEVNASVLRHSISVLDMFRMNSDQPSRPTNVKDRLQKLLESIDEEDGR